MLTLSIHLFERNRHVATCPIQEALDMGLDLFCEVQELTGRRVELKWEGNWPEPVRTGTRLDAGSQQQLGEAV